MTEALVAVNVASLYREPSTSSELVTQAILGAVVRVRETRDGFCHVETEDRYAGWITEERLTPTWDDADYLKTSIATLFAEVYAQPDAGSEMRTKLVVGTRVAIAHRPEVGDWVPLLLPDRTEGYVHQISLNVTHSEAREPRSSSMEERLQFLAEREALRGDDALRDFLIRMGQDTPDASARHLHDLKRQVFGAIGRQAVGIGKRLIGTPYLWGGCTPFGIDCSGFVQLAYKLSGVQLLRDAGIQFEDRRFQKIEDRKSFAEAAFEPGDLVVFRRLADGPITHIGMALGDGRFLHSSGGLGVHIDPCDHPKYTATFAGAIRLSPDADLAIEAA